jgi:hypothetical protein
MSKSNKVQTRRINGKTKKQQIKILGSWELEATPPSLVVFPQKQKKAKKKRTNPRSPAPPRDVRLTSF